MQQIFWAAHIAVAHTQKNIKSYGLAARWRKLCGQRNVPISTAVGMELTPDDLLPRHPHFPFQTRLPKKMQNGGSSAQSGQGSRGRARLPGLGRTVVSAEEEKASPVIRRAEPQSLPGVSTHSVGPTGARAAAREAKAEQLRLQLRDKEENRVSTYTTRLQDAVAQVVAGGTQVKACSDHSIDDDIKRTTLREYVCPVSFSRCCSLRLTTRCAQSHP